jgi:hypothetical protein
MQCAIIVDVIRGKGATILQLLAGKDESLLVGRKSIALFEQLLNLVNRKIRFNFKLSNSTYTRKAN